MKEFESLNTAEIPTTTINYKEFAHLGINLAYKTDCANQYLVEALMTDGNHLVGSGWEILAASCNNTNTAQYGYKAVAFINKDTKVIHIASAGTKADIHDILDDIRITFHYYPNKLIVVKKFIDEIIAKIGGMEEAAKYTFDTSGHSLGAIVADLTGVELHSRNLNFNKSVTFDSPGSQEVIKYAIAQDLFTGKVTTPIEELVKYSEVYNAEPNLINSTNNHFGQVNLVLPKVNDVEKSESPQVEEGWASYLYNMVGSVVQKASEYLGIDKVIKGINNHKLKNFSNLEEKIILPMADWKQQILENNEYTQKLKNILGRGKDLVLFDTDSEAEHPSMVEVKLYHLGYNDLQQCAMEVNQLGNIKSDSVEIAC
ncbi:hypothetical protein [Rickettsia oklahomensis]|uniref:Lipase family protein n=1 Tax=Rickettsia oklahomensis TaxID=3141789 RepID=A0AAU7BZS6_9RICK